MTTPETAIPISTLSTIVNDYHRDGISMSYNLKCGGTHHVYVLLGNKPYIFIDGFLHTFDRNKMYCHFKNKWKGKNKRQTKGENEPQNRCIHNYDVETKYVQHDELCYSFRIPVKIQRETGEHYNHKESENGDVDELKESGTERQKRTEEYLDMERDELNKIKKRCVIVREFLDNPHRKLEDYSAYDEINNNDNFIKKTIQSARKKCYPINTIEDVYRVKPLSMLAMYGNDIHIYGNIDSLKILANSALICADGTFGLKTGDFNQLYILHGILKNTYVPCIFILMKTREEESYLRAFQMIENVASQFKFRIFRRDIIFMTDMEQASQNALKRIHSGITIKTCHFHFSQAIQNKFKSLDNIKYKEYPKHIDTFLKRICALPLVPKSLIQTAYEEIKTDFKHSTEYKSMNQSEKNDIAKFDKYMITYYIGKKTTQPTFKHEQWCVFGYGIRTNNYAESNNKQVNENATQSMTYGAVVNEIERLLIRNMKKKFDKSKDKTFGDKKTDLIRTISKRLVDGDVECLEYLDIISMISKAESIEDLQNPEKEIKKKLPNRNTRGRTDKKEESGLTKAKQDAKEIQKIIVKANIFSKVIHYKHCDGDFIDVRNENDIGVNVYYKVYPTSAETEQEYNYEEISSALSSTIEKIISRSESELTLERMLDVYQHQESGKNEYDIIKECCDLLDETSTINWKKMYQRPKNTFDTREIDIRDDKFYIDLKRKHYRLFISFDLFEDTKEEFILMKQKKMFRKMQLPP